MPLAVIVGSETESAPEILASSFQENGRAAVIGGKTKGYMAQKEDRVLENGYAFRIISGLILGPKGKSWLGVAVRPAIPVETTEAQREASVLQPEETRLKIDAQLAAAIDTVLN